MSLTLVSQAASGLKGLGTLELPLLKCGLGTYFGPHHQASSFKMCSTFMKGTYMSRVMTNVGKDMYFLGSPSFIRLFTG